MTAMSTRLGVIYASRWSRVACAAPHSPPPPPRAWTDNATQDDYWGSFSSMHGVAWRSETRLGTPRCCPSAHIGSAATLPPPQKQISGGAEMDTYARSLFARSRYACWGRVQKKSLPPLCTRLPSPATRRPLHITNERTIAWEDRKNQWKTDWLCTATIAASTMVGSGLRVWPFAETPLPASPIKAICSGPTSKRFCLRG